MSVILFLGGAGGFGLDLSLPLAYDGDSLLGFMLFKTLAQGDWFPYLGIRSDRLGAPFGSNLADFPVPDQLHFALVRLLSFFSGNPFWLFNAYYIGSFALVTISFMYAARKFRVGYLPALAFGLLYSFLPFHLHRYGHLFLAAYFTIPPLSVIVLWTWSKRPVLFAAGPGGKLRFSLRSRKLPYCLTILLLAGGMGVYYACFFGLFMLVAGLSAALYRKRAEHLVSALLLSGVMLGSVALAGLSNMAYWHEHGRNREVGVRQPFESEEYGLKLTNLLVPKSDNRIHLLARMKARYRSGTGIVEGYDEPLGLTASFGLLFLLCHLIFGRKGRRFTVFDKLGMLVMAGTLVATMGGFAYFFATMVTPAIRSWNRISVYLALFSLLAVLFLLLGRWQRLSKRAKLAFAALFFIALYEQVTPDYLSVQEPIRSELLSDRDFIREIERRSPPGAAILQLPYLAFPEQSPLYKMTDYAPARGPIFSERLRWSYGAMRGRPEAARIEEASRLPLDLARARALGYSGIYIDRFGLEDGGKALEESLARQLKTEPLVSRDGRLSYFLIE